MICECCGAQRRSWHPSNRRTTSHQRTTAWWTWESSSELQVSILDLQTTSQYLLSILVTFGESYGYLPLTSSVYRSSFLECTWRTSCLVVIVTSTGALWSTRGTGCAAEMFLWSTCIMGIDEFSCDSRLPMMLGILYPAAESPGVLLWSILSMLMRCSYSF